MDKRKLFRNTRNKYRNVRVTVDGMNFMSKREASFYLKLKTDDTIRYFICQPVIKFPCGIQYISDFKVVYTNGEIVYYDVKSIATKKDKVYRLKIRMLKYHYPEINFKEVVN